MDPEGERPGTPESERPGKQGSLRADRSFSFPARCGSGTSRRVTDPRFEQLRSYVDASEPWFREHLRALVEHRTVSPGAVDPAPIRAGAEAARAIMQEAGAQAELVECSGTPAVLARFSHPEPRARVVVYNHLDVQPADETWDQADPFGMEVQPDPRRGFL